MRQPAYTGLLSRLSGFSPRHAAMFRVRGPHRLGRRERGMAHWLRSAVLLGTAIAASAVACGPSAQARVTELASDPAQNIPLLGSSVLSPANLAKATSQFGRMPIVRVYFPGLPGPKAWAWAGLNKSAVIVSFKALPTTVLSGADDAQLRQFFTSAPRGHAIYYSYFHEPEDNIADGQFTAPDYRAAWKHIAALAAAAHNPFLHSTLILMNYDLVPASHRNWRDYLPGGGVISVLAWDAYPVGSATNKDPQLTPPARFMGPAIAASRSVGLPYGFAEFGLSTAHGRPHWLTSVGKYLLHSKALFASYFDGNSQYPTLQLTDSASIAVWRQYVHDSEAGQAGPDSGQSVQSLAVRESEGQAAPPERHA
jgi:hypothetical protein